MSNQTSQQAVPSCRVALCRDAARATSTSAVLSVALLVTLAAAAVGCAEQAERVPAKDHLLTVFVRPPAAEVYNADSIDFDVTATVVDDGAAAGTDTEAQPGGATSQARATQQRLAGTAAGKMDPQAEARARRRARRRARWAKRLAFEQQRHAEIDTLVGDLRAGRRSLVPHPGKRVVPQSQGAAAACDDTTMAWRGACTTDVTLAFRSPALTVDFKLLDVVGPAGARVNVLLDTSHLDEVVQGAKMVDLVVQAASLFADSLPQQLAVLGQSGGLAAPVDHDGDGRLTVAFTDQTAADAGRDVVGFFDPRDVLPAADAQASGNGIDLLWVRLPGRNGNTVDGAVGTLVHELTHLVSYALRVQARNNRALQEAMWLDEALAHAMEDVSGWGASSVGVMEEALDEWSQGSLVDAAVDTLPQRGRGLLLIRYLIDREAQRQGAEDAASGEAREAATALFGALLTSTKRGFDHDVFAEQVDETGFGQWLAAVFASGDATVTHDDVTPYAYLPTGVSASTGQVIGFNGRGTYVDHAGQKIQLPGVDHVEVPLADLDLSFQSVPVGGSVLYEIEGTQAADLNVTVAVDPDLDPETPVVSSAVFGVR